MTTRIAVAVALAIVGFAIAPGIAQGAVTKIPVNLTLTGVDEEGGIEGQVTSAKSKCASGIDVFGENSSARLSTTSDESGNFTYTFDPSLSSLGYEDFEAYVQKGQKFGKKKRKKVCDASNVVQVSLNGVDGFIPSVNTDDTEYDDVTKTFSGTLTSEDPACTQSVPLVLFRVDSFEDYVPVGNFVSAVNGSFSYSYGSQPPYSTSYFVNLGEPIVRSEFSGDTASVSYCDPGGGQIASTPNEPSRP